MSILVNRDSRVCVQGITGREGMTRTRLMVEYGTNVVAGVTPGKGGQEVLDVPVYDTMFEAMSAVKDSGGIDISVLFVPAPLVKSAALEAFEQPKIIIAGGYDKNLPFDELGRKIASNAKAAVLLGQTAQKIAKAIKEHKNISAQEHKGTRIEIVDSLSEAVQSAARLAEPGDVVLLSPACASYDMFENFQQRGLEFTRLVRGLNS